jgi:hypothetical protein
MSSWAGSLAVFENFRMIDNITNFYVAQNTLEAFSGPSVSIILRHCKGSHVWQGKFVVLGIFNRIWSLISQHL